MMVGMNAERVLVASEMVGIGFAAIRKASKYATERIVFGREIGMNQGIQHPLADAWMVAESILSSSHSLTLCCSTLRPLASLPIRPRTCTTVGRRWELSEILTNHKVPCNNLRITGPTRRSTCLHGQRSPHASVRSPLTAASGEFSNITFMSD